MHDSTLDTAPVDLKELETDIQIIAKKLNITQAAATTAVGYVMKLTNRVMTAKEVYQFIIELVKSRAPEQLTMDERLLLVTVGILRRKVPFVASASKIGRNELCPCGSGAKYKNCCLALAKEHDYNRFYNITGGMQ